MKCTMALAQMAIKPFDPERNLKKADQLTARAKGRKAQLIVFPEDFLFGSLANRPECIDDKGRYRRIMQEMARRYRIDMVAGTIIEKTRQGVKNRCYYFNAQGKKLGCYEKINLWLTERTYVNYGNEPVVVPTRFGKIGLAVCWDLAFPELFRRLARRGAHIAICPSYWKYGDAGPGLKIDPLAEVTLVNTLTAARSMENGMVMCFVNGSGGQTRGGYADTLIGRSQISLPFKGTVKRLDHDKAGLLINTVDTSVLKTAEKAYRLRADLASRIL